MQESKNNCVLKCSSFISTTSADLSTAHCPYLYLSSEHTAADSVPQTGPCTLGFPWSRVSLFSLQTVAGLIYTLLLIRFTLTHPLWHESLSTLKYYCHWLMANEQRSWRGSADITIFYTDRLTAEAGPSSLNNETWIPLLGSRILRNSANAAQLKHRKTFCIILLSKSLLRLWIFSFQWKSEKERSCAVCQPCCLCLCVVLLHRWIWELNSRESPPTLITNVLAPAADWQLCL